MTLISLAQKHAFGVAHFLAHAVLVNIIRLLSLAQSHQPLLADLNNAVGGGDQADDKGFFERL